MIKRRKTKIIKVGQLRIGSDYPVSIQSMAKADTCDIKTVLAQIREMEKHGCELVRVAVKNVPQAKAISQIKKYISIPIAADVHFDYTLAVEAIKNGADKIRINPGNIIKRREVEKIIDSAKEKAVPIRVGVNSGSFKNLLKNKKYSSKNVVEEVLKYLEYFERKKFEDIIISLKFSDPAAAVEAYRKMAVKCDYPFHLGITAAGLAEDGIIKSAIGIGALLLDGIGDTIRVSLTCASYREIETAKQILSASGVRHFGPEIICCPTCGRCQVDIREIAEKMKAAFKKRGMAQNLVIAVMGCEVNGPGEAEMADIGIAFGKNKGAIFCKGKIIKTVSFSEAVSEMLNQVRVQKPE